MDFAKLFSLRMIRPKYDSCCLFSPRDVYIPLFTAKPQGPCWFCLGSPEVEKHLVVSVGTEVSYDRTTLEHNDLNMRLSILLSRTISDKYMQHSYRTLSGKPFHMSY